MLTLPQFIFRKIILFCIPLAIVSFVCKFEIYELDLVEKNFYNNHTLVTAEIISIDESEIIEYEYEFNGQVFSNLVNISNFEVGGGSWKAGDTFEIFVRNTDPDIFCTEEEIPKRTTYGYGIIIGVAAVPTALAILFNIINGIEEKIGRKLIKIKALENQPKFEAPEINAQSLAKWQSVARIAVLIATLATVFTARKVIIDINKQSYFEVVRGFVISSDLTSYVHNPNGMDSHHYDVTCGYKYNGSEYTYSFESNSDYRQWEKIWFYVNPYNPSDAFKTGDARHSSKIIFVLVIDSFALFFVLNAIVAKKQYKQQEQEFRNQIAQSYDYKIYK